MRRSKLTSSTPTQTLAPAEHLDEHVREKLKAAGIRPSVHRVAIGRYILTTDAHPTADQIWELVSANVSVLSRATVYNTLNLFVKKGLLRELVLDGGVTVFDPKLDPHHHFIDEHTGRAYDVPWDAITVKFRDRLDKHDRFDVKEYQVVMRGKVSAR
jgi:Fe2+ or Zn2+ uptake regulation protein